MTGAGGDAACDSSCPDSDLARCEQFFDPSNPDLADLLEHSEVLNDLTDHLFKLSNDRTLEFRRGFATFVQTQKSS